MATTACKAEDNGPSGWRPLLASAVLFLCLANHSPAQKDMLHRVALDERLAKVIPPVGRAHLSPALLTKSCGHFLSCLPSYLCV